jgi:hypothetical protein
MAHFPRGLDELTGAWLEGVLGKPIEVASVERIGVGFGIDGIIARVSLSGDASPKTLVAKWCEASSGEHESRFMREVAPLLGAAVPELLGFRTDPASDRALLLLEDIAPATQDDVVLGMSREHAETLAKMEARFHTVFWNRVNAPAVAWLPEWRGDVADRTSCTAERLPRFMIRCGDRLAPRIRELTSELPQRLEDAYASLQRAPQTVVHGDLHGENVLFRPTGEPVILDWTDASRGPAAADVARLLVEALTIDARRAREDDLLRVYVSALTERGVSSYGVDRLRHDIHRAVIALFAWTIRWVGAEAPPDPSIPRMEAIVHNLVDNCSAALEDGIDRLGR